MSEVPTKQSYVSDKLVHLAGRNKPTDEERFELLCSILDSGLLKGRGTGQGNIHLDFAQALTSNELLVPEAVCFCDIPLKDLGIHMDKYSHFGVAFTKVFMRSKGCNPVYYVSMHSPCTDHRYPRGDSRREVKWGDFFQEAFDRWYPTVKGIDPSKLSPVDNLLLWYFLGHLKFFDNTLADDDPRNYYMEREWRRIGEMEFKRTDVATVILPSAFVPRFRAEFSDFNEDRIHGV